MSETSGTTKALGGACIDLRSYHDLCDVRDELALFLSGNEMDWKSLTDTRVSIPELERRWSAMIQRMASVQQIRFGFLGKRERVGDEEEWCGTHIGEQVTHLSLSDLRQFYFDKATSGESCGHYICEHLGEAKCLENLKGLMQHAFSDSVGRAKKSPIDVDGVVVGEDRGRASALWLYCNLQTIILVSVLVGSLEGERQAAVLLARCRQRILSDCLGKQAEVGQIASTVYVVT